MQQALIDRIDAELESSPRMLILLHAERGTIQAYQFILYPDVASFDAEVVTRAIRGRVRALIAPDSPAAIDTITPSG